MKKIFLFSVALAMTLVACNKEPIEQPSPREEGTALLTFTSERPQLQSGTKTAWDADNGIVWSTGDKIRVAYTLDGSWMGKEQAGTAKLFASNPVTIDGSNPSVGTFTVPVSSNGFSNPNTNGSYVFYGLYPSTAVSDTDAPNAPNISVKIPSVQTPSPNTFDSKADILVGKTEAMAITGIPSDPILINWTRVVAHGFLTFQNFQDVEDGESISEITLTAQEDANIVGTQTISLATGEYSATSASNKITIEATNLGFVSESIDGVTMKNLKVWISILPATITSLSIDVETDRAHYTRSISNLSLSFEQNKKNNLRINMATANRESKTAAPRIIDDGDYLVTISSSKGGNKMMSAASSSPQKAVETATEMKDGKYLADADAVWTIKYNSTDGTYSIKSVSKEKYLSGTSSAVDLVLADEPTYFTATQLSEGEYTFNVSGSGNTRYISYNYNDGSDRFALYVNSTSTDYVKDITLLPAQAKESQVIEETPKAGTDVLNLDFTGISGTSYAGWGAFKGSATNAYYIGNSAGDKESIQLRSNNNNSGIVVWKSSGYVKSITVVWNSATSSGRTLDIYGKHSAYSETTELYATDADTQGTRVGSIVKGTSTTYTFTDNYEYIGLRSRSGAMYITSISIEWGTVPLTETVSTPVISFDSSTNKVSITCATEGASIFYTTNGDDPTSDDTLYSSPIYLNTGDSFTVKAIAIKSGMNNSAVASKAVEYFSGSGETKTATIKSTHTGNAVTDLDSVTESDNDITAVFSKNGQNNGIYESTSQIRVYQGNTITLSGGTITSVTVTCSAENYNKGFSASPEGTISTSNVTWSWTGSATELVLTSSGTSRITSIEVEYQ